MSSKPEDASLLPFIQAILEEDRDKAQSAYDQCLRHKTDQTIEIRLDTKWTPPGTLDEEIRWIMFSTVANVDNDQVTGVIGCITDISHLKWAEQLQSDMAKRAKEAKLQQERFFDMTSHELRNPLSAILQCAEDITLCMDEVRQKQPLDSDIDLISVYDNAQSIILCASHQKRIIDDILTVSKLDSAMLSITPVATDPCNVVDRILLMLNAELRTDHINFKFVKHESFLDRVTSEVYCDPSRLTQILINLLSNAIKFTKNQDTRDICLTLKAYDSPLSRISDELHWFPSRNNRDSALRHPDRGQDNMFYLMFTVQDTGKGMNSDEMSLLFKRFSQASPKTHVKYGGSGLGLFISRELIELQGGMIASASTPSLGSTFAFYIQVAQVAAADIESFVSPATRAVTKQPSFLRSSSDHQEQTLSEIGRLDLARPTPKSLAILIVEDNMLNQKVLCKQLQRLGCTVYVANHGLEALDFLETTRFWQSNKGSGTHIDVILMDWEMPVCDGLACTRRIREMEVNGLLTEHMIIIATTANARPEQTRMAFEAGMDNMITKPFKVAELMNLIRATVA